MLYFLAFMFMALWLLGLMTSYTFGGFIHILIVLALVVLIVRIVSGKSLTNV